MRLELQVEQLCTAKVKHERGSWEQKDVYSTADWQNTVSCIEAVVMQLNGWVYEQMLSHVIAEHSKTMRFNELLYQPAEHQGAPPGVFQFILKGPVKLCHSKLGKLFTQWIKMSHNQRTSSSELLDKAERPGLLSPDLCVFSIRSELWIRWRWRECQQRGASVCRGLNSEPCKRDLKQTRDR